MLTNQADFRCPSVIGKRIVVVSICSRNFCLTRNARDAISQIKPLDVFVPAICRVLCKLFRLEP